jgi:lipid A ethanolaminephosphotransferase
MVFTKKETKLNAVNMIKSHHLIIFVAIFFISFDNIRFFSNILEVYPLEFKNIGFLLSLAWGFTGAIILLLSLVCFKYTIKPIIIILLLLSSFASYFMNSYNTVIDDSMINNILSTDIAESLDLLSLKLIFYVVLLGVLPSYLVYKIQLSFASKWQEAISRIKLFSFTLLSILAVVFIYSDFYSSFFREHKPLRYYSNPSYYVFSTGKYISGLFQANALAFETIGKDAHIPKWDIDRELIIFVVGETARADRFSLNGYKRETNPLLKKEAVVSFTNFWSCGTSTAVSVPCMFSKYNESQYEKSKALATENVLDVLTHADVNVLWLDNNSNSKGVADRVSYQSYKNPEINSICDTECRDVGMLKNLQRYIDEHKQGDILIVLHQMGQHGPAYYKRYPLEFEKFTPVCKTNQLEDCSREELSNAYDNAILYTDYFLSEVISFLKQNDDNFEAAMFYVSDHGESLGENGLYLHGLPNIIAPDTQRHVPAIVWLGKHFYDMDIQSLAKKQNRKYTHDNVFHTLLGFMEIESSVYDQNLDILHN